MILAGDIGGTKTHLAFFKEEGLECVRDEKFLSRSFSSLSEIVSRFVSSSDLRATKACFGLAGPVEEGRCQATNLPWVIESKELSQQLKIEHVFLINDLEANGWGLRCLSKQEIGVVNPGSSYAKGNQALIAAGTGLGEAGLYWDGKTHHPFACEGGHADFAPRNELEMELLRYLRKKFDHVSYERVLSGPGIYNLYRFLIDLRLEKESEALCTRFAMEDPARVITEQALQKQDRACIRTVEWFCSLYGSESGNLALKMLSHGGLYIGGGIAPKILEILQSGAFMKAFVEKGRFAEVLSSMPVYVVLNDNAALLGAAKYATEH